MVKIFIAHRRIDRADDLTQAVHRELQRVYGKENVFFDEDPSRHTVGNYVNEIDDKINESHVVLVAIGPGWLHVTDNEGSRRLDDPKDPLRHEIESALRREDKIVIPLLLHNASMPTLDELPPSINQLANQNGLTFAGGAFFDASMAMLKARIEEATGPNGIRALHRWRWVFSVVAAMLAVVGWLVFSGSLRSPRVSDGTSQSPPHQGLTEKAMQSLEFADKARLEDRRGEANELYDESIRYARECIDKFGSEAEEIQRQLELERIELPPKAGVVDDAQRDIIGKRGVLNDVATCWWAIGQSEHHLGHEDKAMEAYQSLRRLTYARCFTADGASIWSPPDKAASHLNQARSANSQRAP